jgi:molybdopterin/thiamine biosynthesis adenylyltransferase
MAIPPSLQRRLPDMTNDHRRLLAESRVLVVGAESLALAAVRNLAAAGVGVIGLLDISATIPTATATATATENDLITDEVLATLSSVDSSTTVTVHTERLGRRANTDAAAAIIDGYNLVIDASDTVPVRFLVSDTCAALGLPLVWASVSRVNGQLTVFPGNGATSGAGFRDLFPAQDHPVEPHFAAEYLLGALRGQLGALMAAEAVKVIAGIGEPVSGKVLLIDADSGRFSEVSFAEAAAEATNTAAEAGSGAVSS